MVGDRLRQAASNLRDRGQDATSKAVRRARQQATVENVKAAARRAAMEQDQNRRGDEMAMQRDRSRETFRRAEQSATMGPPTMATLDPMGTPEGIEVLASVGGHGAPQDERGSMEELAHMGGGGHDAGSSMGGLGTEIGFATGGGPDGDDDMDPFGLAADFGEAGESATGFDLGVGAEDWGEW